MSRTENFGFEVFNVACGDRFTINQLFTKLRESVSLFNPSAMEINVRHQEPRAGDILHSHANIDKAAEQSIVPDINQDNNDLNLDDLNLDSIN